MLPPINNQLGAHLPGSAHSSGPRHGSSYLANKVEEALLALKLVLLGGGQISNVQLKFAAPDITITVEQRKQHVSPTVNVPCT
jgi:hypothetical protein